MGLKDRRKSPRHRVTGDEMAGQSPKQRYARLLMDRMQQERHPNSSDLDRVEQLISTREEAAEYLDYLFERVEQTRRPPTEILNRLDRILS